MKKEEAKREIIKLWLSRSTENKTSPHTMIFYNELKKERPDLLKFRIKSTQDRYQVISSFVWKYIETQNI